MRYVKTVFFLFFLLLSEISFSQTLVLPGGSWVAPVATQFLPIHPNSAFILKWLGETSDVPSQEFLKRLDGSFSSSELWEFINPTKGWLEVIRNPSSPLTLAEKLSLIESLSPYSRRLLEGVARKTFSPPEVLEDPLDLFVILNRTVSRRHDFFENWVRSNHQRLTHLMIVRSLLTSTSFIHFRVQTQLKIFLNQTKEYLIEAREKFARQAGRNSELALPLLDPVGQPLEQDIFRTFGLQLFFIDLMRGQIEALLSQMIPISGISFSNSGHLFAISGEKEMTEAINLVLTHSSGGISEEGIYGLSKRVFLFGVKGAQRIFQTLFKSWNDPIVGGKTAAVILDAELETPLVQQINEALLRNKGNPGLLPFAKVQRVQLSDLSSDFWDPFNAKTKDYFRLLTRSLKAERMTLLVMIKNLPGETHHKTADPFSTIGWKELLSSFRSPFLHLVGQVNYRVKEPEPSALKDYFGHLNQREIPVVVFSQ